MQGLPLGGGSYGQYAALLGGGGGVVVDGSGAVMLCQPMHGFNGHLWERWSYITPIGEEYQLHAPGVRTVLTDEGTGMPPIEYVTQRGPFQHGETLINYFLRPRIIQMLIRGQNTSRNNYWASRAEILDYIRPNRQLTSGGISTGRLRKHLSNGQVRDVDCLIQQGPNFNPRDIKHWDEWAWQEVLRFIAFNPITYDPTLQTFTVGQSATQLVFPITFPIQFGSIQSTSNLTYTGTWLSYPTIVVTGPISSFVIYNNTIGEKLELAANLLAGESLTITLDYGSKTIVKSDGTNLIGLLSPTSNLGTFHIAPHPVATNGVNSITTVIPGAASTTSVTITYYHRYIGF